MDPTRLNSAQPAVPRNTFNTYITYLTTKCSSLRPLFFDDLRLDWPHGKESNWAKQSWIVDSRYWIPDFLSVELAFWIPIVNSWISNSFRCLWLYSGFQSLGFRIPTAKISWIPEYGFTLHEANSILRKVRQDGSALVLSVDLTTRTCSGIINLHREIQPFQVLS